MAVLKRILMLVVLCTCSRHALADVTGTYIELHKNGIFWLQLIDSKDGRLSGHIETSELSVSGNIIQKSTEINGTATDNTVSLTYLILPFMQLELSGSLEGDKLTLNGKMNERRATFRQSVDELRDKLAPLEAVYQAEKVKQLQLIFEANSRQ